jgi:hypothetical protein
MVALTNSHRQVPLIHVVESDDLFLHDQVDVVWFDVLHTLDYHAFQATAARYYEQLFTFNQQQKQHRIERRENPPPPNLETQGQATQRTLLERATLDEQAAALYQRPQPTTPLIHIAPHEVVPGYTPPRLAGRPPKCFFAMLYGFLGTTLAGQPAEPEFVHQRLCENPAFARTCGFTIPRPGKPERQSDIPSLRKLQQFDQIITAAGLWEELALDRVAANLQEGKIQVEATLVHDTTHYHAYSSMQVIELPEAAEESTAPDDKATAAVKVDGKPLAVARVEVARVRSSRPMRHQLPRRKPTRLSPLAKQRKHPAKRRLPSRTPSWPRTASPAAKPRRRNASPIRGSPRTVVAKIANIATTLGSMPMPARERWSRARARCTGDTRLRR